MATADGLPAALILDLDGTLIDAEPVHAEGIARVFADRGITLTQGERSFVIGHAWQEIYAHLRTSARLGIDLEELKSQAIAAKEVMFAEGLTIPVNPGAPELVRTAVALAIPTVIVSGSSRREIEHALPHLGIGELLEFYMGCEDYARGKPAPDGFLAAASRLGVAPGRSLVVEDSEAGIAAGLAAGMRVLATSACNPAPGTPGHQSQRRAHRVVGSLVGLGAADLRALMGEGSA
ncbi:MAG: HAD family phosphatase [Nannocystaceae bacterium]